ncbi:programmed cell death 1 ligand 1 [Bombina bombina]|uniref:programmed cell death 1 ligand 1 n=1 Tax=Bombina bombina TaxID=8345 RepID=UPI00235B2B11|nr:programmed cell death 1 ligand 1 [Bombina bombina]XP_053556587.1 programmed cell death 1 ligand 1 [Bombina bombina]
MGVYRRLVFAITFLSCCGILKALFTIQTNQSYYTAQYGGEAKLECHFQVKNDMQIKNLKVYWEHISPEGVKREVLTFDNVAEIPQSHEYRGRVKILKDELYKGHAILHISNVKVTDQGHYLCLISSSGADYKYITLDVQAPYKQINTSIADVITDSGEMAKEITCKSMGYPQAEVLWLNGSHKLNAVAKTTDELTSDNMIIVTSSVTVHPEATDTLTCGFWNEAFGEIKKENITLRGVIDQRTQRTHMLMLIPITLLIMLIFIVSLKLLGRCKNVFELHPMNSTDIQKTNTTIC